MSSLGSAQVPEEFVEYRFCREFGLSPAELDDLPEDTFALYNAFMRLEAKAGTLKAKQAEHYRM